MNVLLLTPYTDKLTPIFRALELGGDTASIQARPLVPAYDYGADYIVSYGYRHIIGEPWLTQYKGRIINLHISYLPYNRGAAPNLWAWYEHTPHGVSIHEITELLDAGPLLCRRLVHFPDPSQLTLRTSYEHLHHSMGELFLSYWHVLRTSSVKTYIDREDSGTFHGKTESDQLLLRFPNGYDTICAEVREAGNEAGYGLAALRGRQMASS